LNKFLGARLAWLLRLAEKDETIRRTIALYLAEKAKNGTPRQREILQRHPLLNLDSYKANNSAKPPQKPPPEICVKNAIEEAGMVDRPGFEFPGVTLPGSRPWVLVRHTYFSHKFNEPAPRPRGRGFLLFVIMSIGGTPPIPEEDGNLLGDLQRTPQKTMNHICRYSLTGLTSHASQHLQT
jgi:hypothetical protein